VTGDGRERGVVCVNGGRKADVPGTWSATVEWLVARLAPRFPELAFGEVRYRTKSWLQLDSCIADARAAIQGLGAARVVLLGFSMGGAVSIAAAGDPAVERVVGLAPWIPRQLPLDTLPGKRLDVIQGSLDRPVLGLPGVSAASSRQGFERARAIGIEGSYTIIPGGMHGVALRARSGRLVPLPRADRWLRLVSSLLEE
jgi:dienelactone hydrolase